LNKIKLEAAKAAVYGRKKSGPMPEHDLYVEKVLLKIIGAS